LIPELTCSQNKTVEVSSTEERPLLKIALIGASGFVGSALRAELLGRSHSVTALVRHADEVPPARQLVTAELDVLKSDSLAEQLDGHDAVISAFSGRGYDDPRACFVKGTLSIIAAAKRSGTRLLLAGPPLSSGGGAQVLLTSLETEKTLDWTLVGTGSLRSGARTTRVRLVPDGHLFSRDEVPWISVEDYAYAMVEELERRAHPRRHAIVTY